MEIRTTGDYPPEGKVTQFRWGESIAAWDDGMAGHHPFVVATEEDGTDRGAVWVTTDITGIPPVWTQVGSELAAGFRGCHSGRSRWWGRE